MRKLLFLMLTVFLLLGCQPKSDIEDPIDDVDIEDPTEDPDEDPIDPVVFRSVFTGAVIAADEKVKAVAVMIENSAAARPQSGIGMADIVYEIAVDGWSVSRFLAVFQSQFPSKVGPVRSGRIPFVQIASEWMIPFAHYGAAQTGSGNAYEMIRNIRWPIRFDGVSGLNDDFFSRDPLRNAPHNAYFDAASALNKLPELTFERRFTFDESPTDSLAAVSQIRLDYSSVNKVRYNFDADTKKYLRFINDKPMMDHYTNVQVAVTNIIVIHAPHRAVESYDYVLVDFVGSGKAEVFVNGKHIVGQWIKADANAITRYQDSLGNEIRLSPGNTWIQVVSDRVKISVQ